MKRMNRDEKCKKKTSKQLNNNSKFEWNIQFVVSKKEEKKTMRDQKFFRNILFVFFLVSILFELDFVSSFAVVMHLSLFELEIIENRMIEKWYKSLSISEIVIAFLCRCQTKWSSLVRQDIDHTIARSRRTAAAIQSGIHHSFLLLR